MEGKGEVSINNDYKYRDYYLQQWVLFGGGSLVAQW